MNYLKGLLLGSVSGIAIAMPAWGHGVDLGYRQTQAVEITATFDSGEPMANAQVAVYAPDDPSQPWLTGTTDEQGRFVFSPDRAEAGTWEVTVRQAGHGDVIAIPVDEDAGATLATTSGHGDLSPLQRWVLAAAVIWGFIGTALFFARGKR
ncbi:Carboxypeptidase regulatory-like domain protein [Halomicronema hongdechloris C2206]|uniref:Carboxypeptidase regulatory-like domain protein n=1 Tax=Halomicronema hongdechloris C2206 TaxID=1641165 RepID=A0A1Z3HLZ5_9CYAN|nr:carboxypeptidase-like regulatory domain-containing protein [Halomicronema hongdechloris]ASC71127.1 Carboxypeptidase regulatory-like domain protein [Halomicronema hongdechloris C2206]